MGKVYIGVTAVGGHKLWGVVEGCAGGVNFPTTTKEERRASPLLIYIYSLLFMVHPVVFLIGRFAGQVHAEFL